MAAFPVPRFDQFYRYAELTRLLQDYAQAAPGRGQLQSPGRSHDAKSSCRTPPACATRISPSWPADDNTARCSALDNSSVWEYGALRMDNPFSPVSQSRNAA